MTADSNRCAVDLYLRSALPGSDRDLRLASDGDNDCDQMRCITIVCPDLCEGVVCDDGNECTGTAAIRSSGQCSNDWRPTALHATIAAPPACGGECDRTVPIALAGGRVQPDELRVDGRRSSSRHDLGESLLRSVRHGGQNGHFYVNQSSYLGTSTFDTLAGSGLQDILLGRMPSGTQRSAASRGCSRLNSFDILVLADDVRRAGRYGDPGRKRRRRALGQRGQ